MRHLKRFNENESIEITEKVIRDCFAHTFDLLESDNYEINEAYFRSEDSFIWSHNDFSDNKIDCKKGFNIKIDHSFYGTSTIDEFEKYTELINQLLEDIKRFNELYSPIDIFFDEGGNSEINVLIQI